MEQLVSERTDIKEISCLSIVWKLVEKIQVSLKSYKSEGTLREDLCTLSYYLAEFFLQWELFQKRKAVETS